MATKQEIITRFHLYMDDTTELSSQEESDLFDKVYNEITTDRPWEFLKTTFTGTQSTTVPYISLPSNFGYLNQNHNFTETNEFATGPVVFVGPNYTPYKIINIGDRRQYRNKDGFAYIDIVNMRLYFTVQPNVANTVEFDYSMVAPDLALADSPIFPSRFSDVIYHGMCVNEFVIQQSDKAKSYASENAAMYKSWFSKLAMWNARLIQTS